MIFTAEQCREKAAEKLVQGARNIGHRRTKLRDAAEAWLLLASKLEQIPKRSKAASGFPAPQCFENLQKLNHLC
jgi:hypothetical protein